MKRKQEKNSYLAPVGLLCAVKKSFVAFAWPCITKISAYFCVFCQPVLLLHLSDGVCPQGNAPIGYEFVIDMKDTEFEPKAKTAKNGKKSTKVTFKKRIKVLAINLLAMLLVIAILPCLVLAWVDSYTNHGETCAVPDVCGIQLEEAIEVLGSEKLGYAVVERRFKENAAADEIVMQYPAPGSSVKEGRKIGLVVNTSVKPNRTIPQVIDNRTYREAESHIKASGFVIERVDTIPGEKDWVYELRYNGKRLANGEAIPMGSSLTVVIGSGQVEDADEPVFDSNFDI